MIGSQINTHAVKNNTANKNVGLHDLYAVHAILFMTFNVTHLQCVVKCENR
jgi:hypothetical protein